VRRIAGAFVDALVPTLDLAGTCPVRDGIGWTRLAWGPEPAAAASGAYKKSASATAAADLKALIFRLPRWRPAQRGRPC